MLIQSRGRRPGGTAPLTALNWAGQSGSYWSLSAGNATGGTGNAGGSEALKSAYLPGTDHYFEVEISGGHSGYINFLGVCAGWTQNQAKTYNASGSSTWYWSGTLWREGASVGAAPAALTAGLYRFAVAYGSSLLYAKNLTTGSSVGSMSLPVGTTTSNLRACLLTQVGYAASPSVTMRGYASGSGGLY